MVADLHTTNGAVCAGRRLLVELTEASSRKANCEAIEAGRGIRSESLSVCRMSTVDLGLVSHDDAERAFPVHNDPIHLLVLSFGYKREVDPDWLAVGFSFRGDSIHAPCPLFKGARVPVAIVVDHEPAKSTQNPRLLPSRSMLSIGKNGLVNVSMVLPSLQQPTCKASIALSRPQIEHPRSHEYC